jgi:hypothetical protein
MTDPEDTATRPLPVTMPMRLVLHAAHRIIHAELGQDLLGDWIVTHSWTGKANGKRSCKSILVANHEEGLAVLETLVRRHEKSDRRRMASGIH